MGEIENTTITNDTFGLLPSIAQFMKKPSTDDVTSATADEKVKGHFRYFYKFMCDSDVYLVSKDHPALKDHIISEELLLDVIKGNQRKVLDFDFTEIDNQREREEQEDWQEAKDIMEFKNMPFVTPRDKLMREYSYFRPNREFSGKMEEEKWKKVDDGTFIDNGYR